MIPISQTGQLWTATHQGERDRRRAEERLGELVARWTRRRRPSTRQPRTPGRPGTQPTCTSMQEYVTGSWRWVGR